MHTLRTSLTLCLIALLATGCSWDNRDTGTAIGAAAGGLAGHALGGGTAGTIAGAVGGGIIGNQIAK